MLATTVPSLLILGTDAALAAAPATPVQLAHACLRAGYQMVVPSSWGDELVAARALDRVRETRGPVIQCSCPRVSELLGSNGETISPMLVCLVAPPVAAAQYLRSLYAPARIQVTFAGACAAGSHESIDRQLTPESLMAELAAAGIRVSQQPTEFDSVIPPDRRRFFSEPGGVPSPHALRQLDGGSVELVELHGDDVVVQIAQHLLSSTRVLLDPSVQLGCCCSGVAAGIAAENARARVRSVEPPRAISPVVDHAARIALDAALPPVDFTQRRMPEPRTAPSAQRTSGASEAAASSLAVVAEPTPRRRSPPSVPRPVLGAMPLRRTEGRQLPRAYVARRRSSPRGMRRTPLLGAGQGERAYWPWIAAAGVAVGILASWLLGFAL